MDKYNKDELEKMIVEQNKTYSSIGNMYGVSGNAIKKAAKRMGIIVPKRRIINPQENFKHYGTRISSFVNRISDENFIEIINSSNTWKEIGAKLGYKNQLSYNVKESIIKRCEKLGMSLVFDKKDDDIMNKTKGELFAERKNWQSARSAIRRNAREIFLEHYLIHKCAICGYDKYIEVAHIKPVSEFENSATIREINSITNLIGLCPNHHWEYDNGFIKI